MNNTLQQHNAAPERPTEAVNVMDILRRLIAHWPWFVLSVLVFGGFYYYQYSKAPFVYAQSETVMIKTPMNTVATARITRTNSPYNSVSVAGEIMQLKSKELMAKTVRRVNADVSYSLKQGLRQIELYKLSPIQVQASNVSDNGSYHLLVTPLDDGHVKVQEGGELEIEKEWKVALGETVKTSVGEVRITARDNYGEAYFNKTIEVRKQPVWTAATYFVGQLNVVQMENDASLLKVQMEDRSRERAADIISALIEVYNEEFKIDKNQIAVQTAEFINERLEVIESELGAVETKIEQMRTANQGMDVATAGQFYVSDTRQLEGERAQIETDIKLAEMMREYLHSKTGENESIPSNTGLVDAGIESRIVEYNTMLQRRNRLVQEGGTANPIVKDLDVSLASMRENIDKAIGNILQGLEVKINAIRQNEQTARRKALSIPKKQRVMLSVERQQKVKEELYLFLLNKREENALNQAITEDNIKVIEAAFGPVRPIAPIKSRKIAMGVGLGLLFPALILILKMILDTRVRTRQDIEAAITVPFLGEVPLARKGRKSDKGVMVSETSREPLSEAFRILRTNLSFMTHEGKAPQVITFTSFTSGVGKTFSAINLGTTFSYLKKKVVVLDLDLRKGTLTDRTMIEGKGVCHYLVNPEVTVDDILVRGEENEYLDFIPIGALAPNPVELLSGPRLDTLIEELKKRYDYIMIDGVPIGLVADATVVDRVSDLTVFIVRAGKMDKRQLKDIESLYINKKLTNLAAILNGYKPIKGGYGYGYGYGTYGYGQEKKRWWAIG